MFSNFMHRTIPSIVHSFCRPSPAFIRLKRDYCNRQFKGKKEPTKCVDVFQCPWFERCLKWFTTVTVVAGVSQLDGRLCTIHDRDDLKARARCSLLNQLLLFASPTKQLGCGIVPQNSSSFDEHVASKKSSLSRTVDVLMKELDVESAEYANKVNNLLGMAYLQSNKPKKAIKHLKKCNNCSKAMYNLGAIYESGQHSQSGKPDYVEAVRYYSLAASHNHKDAIYNLALIYLYGKGEIDVDTDNGINLLRQAADLGVEEAILFFKEKQMTEPSKGRDSVSPCVDGKLNVSSSAPNLVSLIDPSSTWSIVSTLQQQKKISHLHVYHELGQHSDLLHNDLRKSKLNSHSSFDICSVVV